MYKIEGTMNKNIITFLCSMNEVFVVLYKEYSNMEAKWCDIFEENFKVTLNIVKRQLDDVDEDRLISVATRVAREITSLSLEKGK